MSGWSHPNATRLHRAEERRARVLEQLAAGANLANAAHRSGVSYRSAQRYRQSAQGETK